MMIVMELILSNYTEKDLLHRCLYEMCLQTVYSIDHLIICWVMYIRFMGLFIGRPFDKYELGYIYICWVFIQIYYFTFKYTFQYKILEIPKKTKKIHMMRFFMHTLRF